MADPNDKSSISEIEQELQAIKSSLKELKQENSKEIKAQAKPVARVVSKKTATTKKTFFVGSLAKDVANFLDEAETERLENFDTLMADLEEANINRKAESQALKESCLQDKIARLEWLKQMQRDNEQTLTDFMGRLESQCEKDRQARYALVNQIKGELSDMLGRSF